MIDDNITADESDNNLFDGGIKFLKSNETNSFHSIEPVVASDDEDAEEKDDQDKAGGAGDVQEAGGHSTCTPLGEKLKEGQHSFLTQTTVDNSTPSDNQLSEYKNIILTLKKFNDSVDSAFDCNIVNLFVEEQGRQRIVKEERQKEQKKIAKLGTGKKKITPLREQLEKKKKKILNALLPLESCKVCVKRCNTREERIGQLPGKYRSVGGVEQFSGEVVLPRARCVSGRRHHDWNGSLEGKKSEEAEEGEVKTQPTRNSLHRKGEHSEGNERVHNGGGHLLSGSHFIHRSDNCRGSSPSCTQGFNSITCSMTNSAGGSSTAQGGIEAAVEVAIEVAIDALDQVSQHAGSDGGGEGKTPSSEDADPDTFVGMNGEIFGGKKKLSDEDGSQSGFPNGHVERKSIKKSAPFLQSPSYHHISENYFAVYSSKEGEEGCHMGGEKSVKLEDNLEDRAELSEGRSTPFCVPPNCLDKRQDGEEFPFLCYYGCGNDALQHRSRGRKWSAQSEKTVEKRITIRGRGNSVPGECTSRRRVPSGTDITNTENVQKEEMVEGKEQSENPRYHWSRRNHPSGCVTNERVLPKFKSLSNGIEETHTDGLHFMNASISQGVYLRESSARKEQCYVGKSQGGVLNPWGDARSDQVVHPCEDDGEDYTKEGVERIPFLSSSAGMYNRDDVKKGDLFVTGNCDQLVPPFKGLKVNYRSSRDISPGGSDEYKQHCQQEMNPQEEEPTKGCRNFHTEKDIFFEAIKNIIRIMKEIKKIKTNLKIERNYSLLIQDKKKKNELEKLIDYLTYQKEVRKKLKKHYFDKINKGLFTFLLRSNRVNFFFTEEEVKLLKRWNEIKYTKMSSSSGGNTEGEGDNCRTTCLGESAAYVKGGSPYRRKILHELRHLNKVIGQKGCTQEEDNRQDESLWINGRDESLWMNWGDPPGEAPIRNGRQRKNKNVKNTLRSGYLASTTTRPIWYESYFTHCKKSQKNLFNIFLCLKNVKRKCVSQKFKRKIKNGQIYLSKIYDGGKMLGHVKYIFEELLRRNLPEIVCLHINDCFVDATISFFISLLLLLFKNVNTIKVIRCQIYYSYLGVFLSYQKRNNLRSMHFVCNSIFWTRPPDFRNLRGEMHSTRQQDSFLLYFNTNYVKKRKRKGLSNKRGDATTTQQCAREGSRGTSLKSIFQGRASPSNGAATGDYRIVVKRKKKVARFGVDEFYDCFVLGKEAKVPCETNVLKQLNGLEEPNGVDNERITLNNLTNGLDSPANAYNIHSGSGSDENTSEDSLKEELHECLCTFPRKRIQQANFSMLKKLKLCSNKLNDDALMYICTLIKKDKLKNLKVLDLRWNNFTYRSLLALSLALTNTTVCEGSEKIHWKKRKLHKLLLSGNNIKSSLYSSFLSSFCTCNFIVVKKLDFSMNVIDNDSFAITLKYFKHIFQLQKRKQKKNNIGDVFINLDHNNLKNSPYINKLAQLLNRFPSKVCKSNSGNQTPAKEGSSVGEESRQGVLLSLQYNNIKRGTWGEDPTWGGSTSRIKF
ncbi:Uncharacterized protein PCOAH_00021540, partial [Plasmodium coatneyi]